MPEYQEGLGFEPVPVVHYKKRPGVKAAKCITCTGYITEIEFFCPRCIAHGEQHKLQDQGKELFCLNCHFRCWPASYNHYFAMASIHLCHCENRSSGSEE